MEILTKELNAQIQKINKNYKNKSDLNDDFLEHLYLFIHSINLNTLSLI